MQRLSEAPPLVLILGFGAVVSAAIASACVSVEVVVFKDGRRRVRLGCCWRFLPHLHCQRHHDNVNEKDDASQDNDCEQ